MGVARRHLGLDIETPIELHTAFHEPVEVLETSLGIGSHLGLVWLGSAGLHQVGDHVLDGILEPAGVLHRGPSTEVDDPLSQRGGTARSGGALEGHHLGPCLSRGMRRARPRCAETHDEDVGVRRCWSDVGDVDAEHLFHHPPPAMFDG